MTPAQTIGRALRFLAGAGFVALLVFAPLNFGSTRPGGAGIVAYACGVATLLWAASLVFSGRRPAVPAVVACAAALFVLFALPWITGIAHATSVASFTRGHFAGIVVRWPVSILSRSPADALLLLVALVAAILPLIDLARERVWARTFGLALTLTAVAVGVLALLQNYTRAKGVYWQNDGRLPGVFCGTFFHHTSAGAYFNTAWPLALAFAWLAWNRRPGVAGRSLAVACSLALVILLAAHGGHVSRFPQVAALLIAPVLFFGLGVKLRGPRPWLYGLAGATAIGLLVLLGGRTNFIGMRWRMLFDPPKIPFIQPPESAWTELLRDDMVIAGTSHPGWFGDRLYGWRAALDAISARPLTGHGPGNWIGASSQHSDDPFVRTFYQFLQFTHQDPLQTAVEWGLPAALAFWTLLVGAPVAVLLTRLRGSPVAPESSAIAIAAACALAALLLQAQLDFPLQIPALALNAVVLAALCWAGAASSRPSVSPVA